ncbi:MAG: hypothetical protein AAF468_12605 [Pseudomonadota bacterium]
MAGSGKVRFEALGEDWALKCSTNAICEMEERSGLPFKELGLSLAEPEKMKFSTLRLMVLSLLKGDGSKSVSLERAGAVIDDVGLTKIVPMMAEAIQMAFPEVPDEGEASVGEG